MPPDGGVFGPPDLHDTRRSPMIRNPSGRISPPFRLHIPIPRFSLSCGTTALGRLDPVSLHLSVAFFSHLTWRSWRTGRNNDGRLTHTLTTDHTRMNSSELLKA